MAALPAGQLPPVRKSAPKARPKTGTGTKPLGWHSPANFNGQTTCSVTYTCEYGFDWDQVCDNQRYFLEQFTVGNAQPLFHYDESGIRSGRTKDRWYLLSSRNRHWYRSYAPPAICQRYRCEIDEFPMNSLLESTVFAKQALRAIDGDENGRQGRDWQQWLTASWYPCSTLMGVPPPITWSIGNAVNPSEPRRTGQPAHPIS